MTGEDVDLGVAMQRRRVAIASYLALALAVGLVVVYAVAAQGYRAHQTRLNDGGIWVTDNRDSAYGRMNKPIGQLDGAVFAGLDANLDVAQDDSAIVGINLSGGTMSPLDPSTMRPPSSSSVPIPAAPQVEAAGGTLAVLDTDQGTLWATRVDTVAGVPDLAQVGREAKPLAKVGRTAALAVTDLGTVLAVSAVTGNLLTIPAAGATASGFGPVHSQHLAGRPSGSKSLQLTAVGATPVVLDPVTGALRVVGGGTAQVPPGSVLQQPGPAGDSVLVDTPTSLVEVDLSTGASSTLAGQVSGRPSRPVRLGTCAYGAWSGGTGFVATRCGAGDPMVAGLRAQTTDLVFRVNRGQVVLNDRGDGAVWDVDHAQPRRLDNWDAYRSTPTRSSRHQHDDNPDLGDRRPPKAKDDSFGARPGRSTVLHPLDNDSAPAGRLLAIRAIQQVSDPAARVRISPDGQTVDLTLPPRATGVTTFEYFVDDGRDGVSGHATVRVQARVGAVNQPPDLRAGAKPRVWNIPASGTMTVPVLADWRDNRDGDALTLVSASPETGADHGATATTTDAGAVRFHAPDDPGLVRVRYAATDSLSAPVERTLTFRVESRDGDASYPAVAEPDVIAGQVGKPITVKPLLNDLPGSDPIDPQAALGLAGRVAQPDGAHVTTDLDQGTITLESPTAHTYFLDYQASYGNAKATPGRIRVDVKAPARTPQDPVAMPDQVTLHGQEPALVDVLANDSDPAGGLLEVQNAAADDPTQLDVGVVDGRWLRVSAPRGALAPDPQVVTYQISDGEHSGITGQVVVNQRPTPADDTPVTSDDEVTVRAGNAVAVPVLDNDFSPAGDQLELLRTVAGQRPGRLEVGQDGGQGPSGSAYTVGRQVRYVAPASVSEPQDVQVRYVAVNASGATAPGTLDVTVIPRQKGNDPPSPPPLEGRVVSGDVVKLRLPGSGVDPDGDAVTILGLDSAPALGRILKIGANSIDYQAYPGSVGTDEFSYRLTDALGATSTGTARVVIAPPGTPQAPLAVADAMTVAPGRTASVDVLANDLVSSGDRVTVSLVGPPPGVSLESPTGPVRIQAPRTADGRNEVVVYRISNGLEVSQSTVTLTVVAGYDNPPVVFDAFGATGNGDTVTTDVLATAYDPDGPPGDLRISKVLAPRGVTARVVGGSRIRVSRGHDPTVVPFVVTDGEGAATTGNLYVPAATGGLPYVKPGALLRVKPDGSVSGRLSDLVVNPSGGPVRFTSATRVWTSPQPGLDVVTTGRDTFRIDAGHRYAGPGAMVFEVTRAAGPNAASNGRARTVVLSVPVQVGQDKPILRCPSNSLTVPQGQAITVDILAMCHVWTIDPAQQSSLTYAAGWDGNAQGLDLGSVTGSRVEIRAAGSATPGTTAVLDVSASGSDRGQIRIRVTRTAPPRLIPIKVSDLRFGETRTLDLASYLVPGVRNPRPTVISAAETSGVPVRITTQGTTVSLRALRHVHGHATFRIVMSDAGPGAGPERRVQGLLSLDILDVPGQPGQPLPDGVTHDAKVPMSWSPAVANGAPVTGYQVRDDHGRTTSCGSTACTVTGLHNGTTYRFSVRAHNAVGWGAWSPWSRQATPDAAAGQVSAVRMTQQGDHFISLAWRRPPVQGTQVTTYRVTWTGAGRSIRVTGEHATVTGLDNDTRYRFTIVPYNGFGAGAHYVSPWFQPMGPPDAPGKPTVRDVPQDGNTAQVAVSWPAVAANGPPEVHYDVFRDGTPVCQGVTALSCTDQGMAYDGTTYTYTVTATNKNGHGVTSPHSVGTTYQAVGSPGTWGNDWSAQATGNDQEVQVSYTVPGSRGAQSRVDVLVDGNVNQSFDETGSHAHKITVADDDHSFAISLRVCNEFNRCSTTGGSQSVQPYGPLRDSAITNFTPVASGPNVTYQITGDTNGRPADLVLTHGDGSQQVWHLPAGPFTVTSDPATVGYDRSEQARLAMSDPQGGRGTANAQVRGQAASPPQAHVSVSRGSLCNDGNGSGEPSCQQRGSDPRCTDPSCGHVQFSLDSFVDENGAPAQATCSLSAADGALWGWLGHIWTVSNGTSEFPDAYYGSPGNTVTVTCSDTTGNQGQRATSTFQWPN
ncbi:Ig-like domain-containing protein [Nocardioides cynanchi]|uniref:Ig-like domain-containing protein n=1 Tax=Nocardioides cynanchi TaxID=2558918 RepID=UPI0012441535|nr:Ig-like domain-containing protein [Nocardioides cynanchi]